MKNDDQSATPIMVFETDSISAGIRDLYRRAELPFVEADQANGKGVLRFEKTGFVGKLSFDDRGWQTAIDTIIAWLEDHKPESRGTLLKSPVEQHVYRALSRFTDDLDLTVHHHIPFGYVAGYRADLPRSTARHTIEMSVGMKPDADAEARVILPIRIELQQDHERDPALVERDVQVAEFVCNVGMPMAAIQQGENGKYRLTYSLGQFEDVEIELEEQDRWSRILRSITEHALETTGTAPVAK